MHRIVAVFYVYTSLSLLHVEPKSLSVLRKWYVTEKLPNAVSPGWLPQADTLKWFVTAKLPHTVTSLRWLPQAGPPLLDRTGQERPGGKRSICNHESGGSDGF